ncbi:MAG: SMI1/KNR4 family protein [Armatimonadetes bacterium]|nr:SMI1/KNR4 family protein [Armatimonadota bacterium]
MTIDEFIQAVQRKSPPAPEPALLALEADLGARLPEDYRDFLLRCNGGYVGGRYWFDDNVGVHHVGGLREEDHFSLLSARECYQNPAEIRIPTDLLWIMDDPFGNAICLGLSGSHRGQVFFWDHEQEPWPEDWDGSVEQAGNITVVADSFTEFVAGLHELD